MSVIIAEAPELHLVQQSAAAYVGASVDLFAAIQGAQLTSCLLSYGTLPWVQAYNNRQPLPPLRQGQRLDAATTLRRLRLFEYNTCSNGGNECLPVSAARSLDRLMHHLAVHALRESGHAQVHHCEITRSSLGFLVAPNGERDALLADGTRLSAQGVPTPEAAVQQALAFSQRIQAALVTAGVMQAWEVRSWAGTGVPAEAAD
jgi:hypothetical protein